MQKQALRPLSVLAALGLVVALVLPADAQDGGSSRLHEFVPPDPNEDVRLAATTLDGNLPAALETPSGIATAPDPGKPPDPDHLYTGGTTDDGPESTYQPDRDTRQPDIENYDDPFSPSTAPFKRLRAYDSVDGQYVLKVDDKSTKLLSIGGAVDSTDESFYGDFSVELLPDDLVRIPTVGPGARVLKLHVSPDANVSLLKDGADNWFIRGSERKRVRVVMQLAIPRNTFGSQFADVSFDDLGLHMPRFDRHTEQAKQVFTAIGISREMRPKEVITKMVEYFRAFQPSNEPPKTHGDIYLDLALSKKGVCRHRAFAFLVTGLEMGIPTRMVVNEAHAWVEVFDGTLWHRIDLGGAALNLDQDQDPTRPPHQPPQDPYTWPENSESGSGQQLADKDRNDLQPGQGGGSSSSPTDPGGSSAPSSPTGVDPTQPAPSNPDLPSSTIEVEIVDKTVRRGTALKVKGKVSQAGRGCANVRVDVVVKSADTTGRLIGSLSTDEDGAFEGTAVVPRDLAAGDYDVLVVTAGDKRCGAGASE